MRESDVRMSWALKLKRFLAMIANTLMIKRLFFLIFKLK